MSARWRLASCMREESSVPAELGDALADARCQLHQQFASLARLEIKRE